MFNLQKHDIWNHAKMIKCYCFLLPESGEIKKYEKKQPYWSYWNFLPKVNKYPLWKKINIYH